MSATSQASLPSVLGQTSMYETFLGWPPTSVAIFNVCKVEERETAQMHRSVEDSCCSTVIALFRKGRSKHFISVILDYS